MSKNILAGLFIPFGLIGLNGIAVSQMQNPSGKMIKTELTMNDIKNQNIMETQSKSEFQPLPYSYDALEPFIDKQTVEIHYSKHHKAYYDNFINAVKGTGGESMELPDLFRNISKYPVAVRNNGGGYYNHNFYWESMRSKGGALPAGKLLEGITVAFGSFEGFKKAFSDAGKTRFGSGWGWLIVGDKGDMLISSTPNQDNPLMDIAEKKGIPILTIDVWEHAYYLKYQNKRADYIDAFWNLVNWDMVAKRYEIALKSLSVK